MKIPDFHGLFMFLRKNEWICKACSAFFIFTDLTRFQGPKEAMYQSVGKCFRIHLRAASIHISDSDSDSDAFIWTQI